MVLRGVLVTALVVAVLVSAVGTPVDARPPPQPVCAVCSDRIVEAGAEEGLAIDVRDSSLTVRIDQSGTGHWTARVDLAGSGVDVLRDDASLRDRIVNRVYERGDVAVTKPQSLTTSMSENTLVVEYEVPGMAHESAGDVYVVDFFYWNDGDSRWFYLAADSMTMYGPPGTVVSHAPADATPDDHAVTWVESDQQYDPLNVRSHVVFAPNTGIGSSVATAFGIGVDVAHEKAGDLVAVGAPLALLAAVVALLRRFGHRLAGLPRSQLLAIVLGPLVAVGLTAATVETLVGISGPVTEQVGDFLFYLIYAVAATGAGPVFLLGGPLVVGQILLARRVINTNTGTAGFAEMEAVTRQLLLPAATVLSGQWLLFPLAAAGAAGYDTVYGLVSLLLPALYFIPLAVTRRWGTRLHLPFTAGIVLAPIPVVVAFAPHTGMSLVIESFPFLYVPWALIVAGIGTLAYASGLRLVASENRGT
ncbi:hypothetical protein [Halanaeroarchaeum sulfurireducens]|uniref:hypothetical protein n=1 Tax=Halanaeroarchaeum sulfurireducens TaxID=1604004 RepID=UPI00138E084A|nr:hypothetical protein [Halanaeroarchaeum sulfurireducens]